MPKLFGTNVLLIILAGFLFFMLGSLWYGMIFNETWMQLAGVTEEAANENMARSMAVGLLLSILQAAGIAGILSMAAEGGVTKGLKIGALAWLFFALPTVSYNWNYAGAPAQLLQIDASYQLVGYLIMGAVLGWFRKD